MQLDPSITRSQYESLQRNAPEQAALYRYVAVQPYAHGKRFEMFCKTQGDARDAMLPFRLVPGSTLLPGFITAVSAYDVLLDPDITV